MVNEMRERIIEEAGQAVTDKEVADWYAENAELTVRPATIHVKQIFFKVDTSQRATDPQKALKDAEKRAADAYALIQSGQAFEKIAKERSEGQFADNGGDWGPVPAVQLPPFIVEAAQKLQPGQTSAPFQSQYGFHIVRLIASTPGGKVPLDQAAPEIRRILMRDKGDDAVRKYCAKLMADESKVQVFLDLERQLRLRPELLELYRNEVGKPAAKGN
jgi:parvulin-like peptidyl-prolyl isomerase